MRWKLSAGVLMALAFLIPAAPAVAQAAQPGLNADCQTVERHVYTDIRKLVTIDLDTATKTELEALAKQILAAAAADSLPVLPPAVEEALKGTEAELREFLQDDVQKAWSTALRVTVVRTLTGDGANVQKAAQEALDAATVDAYLAYLNDGLYVARALDCAAQPTATPTVTPTVTPTATATTTVAPEPTSAAGGPGASGGEGGGLPVTGAATGIVAAVGGALLLLGAAGYLIGRRRRSRFVA